MKEQEQFGDFRDPLRILRFSDLVRLGVVKNRSTLRNWIANNNFPEPFRLSKNTIAWRAKDVAEWLDEREAERQELIRRWKGQGEK